MMALKKNVVAVEMSLSIEKLPQYGRVISNENQMKRIFHWAAKQKDHSIAGN